MNFIFIIIPFSKNENAFIYTSINLKIDEILMKHTIEKYIGAKLTRFILEDENSGTLTFDNKDGQA